MKALVSPGLRWNRFESGPLTVHYVGKRDTADTIAQAAAGGIEAVRSALAHASGHFALIVEGPGFVFASVDNCRATPVFYTEGAISNSAEAARADARIAAFDADAVTEVAMSGFTTSRATVYQGLHQLQAGEFLYWQKGDGAPETHWFYRFTPDILTDKDVDTLAARVGSAIDSVMRRLIEDAAGRPVWVPLSGGLDSRLILCKLVEFGCPNVRAFSYGPNWNEEARVAKDVAAALGVPWHFLPSRGRDMRRFFSSKRRKAFWEFANGHNGTPNFQDLLPLCQMMDAGLVKEGDVVVNGQTGDFISGGHIPPHLLRDGVDLDDLFSAIVKKHFSLWESLKTPKNLEMIKGRVFMDLDLNGNKALTSQDIAAAYEQFEYLERQSKFIVSGQRVYDFLGLDWFLPLWDPDFVDVWRNIPARVKVGQTVYKAYLTDYDYKGQFRDFRPCMDGWPGPAKLVLPFARLIRLILGEEIRDRYLRAMAVFGMYGYFFAPYPLFKTIRESQNFRNAISLFTRTWMSERRIPMPAGL